LVTIAEVVVNVTKEKKRKEKRNKRNTYRRQ